MPFDWCSFLCSSVQTFHFRWSISSTEPGTTRPSPGVAAWKIRSMATAFLRTRVSNSRRKMRLTHQTLLRTYLLLPSPVHLFTAQTPTHPPPPLTTCYFKNRVASCLVLRGASEGDVTSPDSISALGLYLFFVLVFRRLFWETQSLVYLWFTSLRFQFQHERLKYAIYFINLSLIFMPIDLRYGSR